MPIIPLSNEIFIPYWDTPVFPMLAGSQLSWEADAQTPDNVHIFISSQAGGQLNVDPAITSLPGASADGWISRSAVGNDLGGGVFGGLVAGADICSAAAYYSSLIPTNTPDAAGATATAQAGATATAQAGATATAQAGATATPDGGGGPIDWITPEGDVSPAVIGLMQLMIGLMKALGIYELVQAFLILGLAIILISILLNRKG